MDDHTKTLRWIVAFCCCGMSLAAAFMSLGFPLTIGG